MQTLSPHCDRCRNRPSRRDQLDRSSIAQQAAACLILVAAVCGQSLAAGGFNGSSSDLGTNDAVATSTPIAMSAWFKLTSTARTQPTLVSVSRSDTNHNFSLLLIESSGVWRVRALSQAGTSSTVTTTTSFSLDEWHHAFCVFYGSTSRKAWLDGNGEGESTANSSPSNLNQGHIGWMTQGGLSNLFKRFTGNIAEVAIWTGTGVENMGSEEATKLASGVRPINLSEFRDNLVLFQPLRRAANEFDSVGPAMTATNVTFDASDHPPVIYPLKHYVDQYGRAGALPADGWRRFGSPIPLVEIMGRITQ